VTVSARANSRDAILDAAEAVVSKDGASRLTLDAVAASAGVSKGGLLYSFPTKEALLEAMIERLCARFEQASAAAQEQMSRDSAAALKAYFSATLDRKPGQDRVANALLAAVANNLDLLKPMRVHHARWVRSLAERPTFARDTVAWLAAEGLWLLELLRVSPLNAEQRREVVRYLNTLIRGESNSRRS